MEYLDTLKSKIISGGTITTYQATKKWRILKLPLGRINFGTT
jgi:hypothetical protein